MSLFINLPAVQIPLPSFVAYFVEKGHDVLSTAYTYLEAASEKIYISPDLYAHLKANALLLFGISIIFWPLLLSLITTFTVMGTWTFWLFTTSIFGILQVGLRMYACHCQPGPDGINVEWFPADTTSSFLCIA
jgi:hypothetical protein